VKSEKSEIGEKLVGQSTCRKKLKAFPFQFSFSVPTSFVLIFQASCGLVSNQSTTISSGETVKKQKVSQSADAQGNQKPQIPEASDTSSQQVNKEQMSTGEMADSNSHNKENIPAEPQTSIKPKVEVVVPTTAETSQMNSVFVAIGAVGRRAVSCDAGKTWKYDVSLNADARCFKNGLDCDHSLLNGRGLSISKSGTIYATFGWGQAANIVSSSNGTQ
jgi:hypothetical protein